MHWAGLLSRSRRFLVPSFLSSDMTHTLLASRPRLISLIGLLIALVVVVLQGCHKSGGGGGGAPQDQLDTSFLDLEAPGYFSESITSGLQEGVYQVGDAEGPVYDPIGGILTFNAPSATYTVDDIVLTLDGADGQALKVVSVVDASSYNVIPAQIAEVLLPGDLDFRVAPDFASALYSGSGSGDGLIDFSNISLCNLVFDQAGNVDAAQSTLLGMSFADNADSVTRMDSSALGGGYLRATILSGGLDLVPTITNTGKVLSGGQIRMDAHVQYDLRVKIDVSGPAGFDFTMPLLPQITVTLPTSVPGIFVVATLDIPFTFELDTNLMGDCEMNYESEYSYSFTIDYDYSGASFGATRDWITDDRDVNMALAGHATATAYLQPTLKATLMGIIGPLIWLKPYITADLELPWVAGMDELYMGIEGGCGISVLNRDFLSGDLLNVPELSWDLFGPGGGGDNSPPVCFDSGQSVPAGASLIQLDATDPDQDPVYYVILTQPANGSLGTLNSVTGRVTYTPDWGFTGTDSFTFTAHDGVLTGNTGTVTLSVGTGNYPPVADFSWASVGAYSVGFDASLSTDSEDPASALLVRWDYENDGVWDTGWSSVKTQSHTYPQTGSVVVALQVQDSGGLVDTKTRTISVLGSGGMSGMAYVPGGTFLMGDHAGIWNSDERPVHPVTLSSFYMDVTEVTHQSYAAYLNSALAQGSVQVSGNVVYQVGGAGQALCDTKASSSLSNITWSGSSFGVTAGWEQHPVVQMSWYAGPHFANWRSGEDGFTPCYDENDWSCNYAANGYRLPTEAEWEYAARGGQYTPYTVYPWGDTINGWNANYWGSGDPWDGGSFPQTTPVAYYDGNQSPAGGDMANGYGLYDMAGNVWEWCGDWYVTNYYQTCYDQGTVVDPTGPVSGSRRVLRGGSWTYGSAHLRSAHRVSNFPWNRNGTGLGFRVLAVRP